MKPLFSCVSDLVSGVLLLVFWYERKGENFVHILGVKTLVKCSRMQTLKLANSHVHEKELYKKLFTVDSEE